MVATKQAETQPKSTHPSVQKQHSHSFWRLPSAPRHPETTGHGAPKDETKAGQLYAKADAAGHATATFNLAFMLRQGHGGPKDEAKARRSASWRGYRGTPMVPPELP